VVLSDPVLLRRPRRELRVDLNSELFGLRHEEKARENRLRRTADRQGLKLVKSPRRDPRAIDFGTYWLMSEEDGYLIPSGETPASKRRIGFTIDEVENYLSGDKAMRAQYPTIPARSV